MRLNESIVAALNGKGSELLYPGEALDLILVAEQNSCFLLRAEVFELKDELQIPQVDLTLYNICNESEIVNLPILEKAKACRKAFLDMLNFLAPGKSYGLKIWLEK